MTKTTLTDVVVVALQQMQQIKKTMVTSRDKLKIALISFSQSGKDLYIFSCTKENKENTSNLIYNI